MKQRNRDEWTGVFPATMCPFDEHYDIDEPGLAEYLKWVASFEGVKGVVTNGHTGEITSLRNAERARVTEIAVQAMRSMGRAVKVVSGVCAEGSHDAIDQALAAKEVGADGILLMPPHHWLRFGRTRETAVGFVQDVAEGAGISIVLHQYPAWTKASYSLEEMLEIVKLPQVAMIKMGTRDMARQRYDYLALQAAAPDVPVVTCHDEYLLASLLEGADGALVGFGGYAPGLICGLVDAALRGDLAAAREMRDRVDRLAKAIYEFGEPSNDAHQRMKLAAYVTGKLSSYVVRPPLRPLSNAVISHICRQLEAAGEELLSERCPNGSMASAKAGA